MFLLDGPVLSTVNATQGYVSSPVVMAGLAVFGCFDAPRVGNNLYAVNASTGKLVWTVPTGGGIMTKPAAADAGVSSL